jgi:multidrug efflux system membrane fusion protein
MDVNVSATPPSIAETSIRPAAPEARAGWRRWQVVVPVCLAVVIAGTLAYRSMSAGRAKPAPPARPVPVVISTVKQGDVQVTLSGLGSVVPTDSVTIHSRVDGQLMEVKFREGQTVQKGALLMQIDPRPYEVQLLQAEGQLAKDEAALKNARADLQRYQTLTKEGILPQQQLDTQVSTVDQAAAAVKSDQAGMASARLNLVYCNITAPVSGVAGLRLVDPGNMVHATDTTGLVVITPVSPIDVMFSIPADHIQHVLASSKDVQRLKVEAYDRDFVKKLATGSLLAVDNQVDPTTGTVRLKAEFLNKDAALFPNQFVNAKLQTDTLHDALTVPAAAVQRSPQGSFVYVVKGDSTVEQRTVEILLTEGDTIALKSGLKAGEKVVIDGLDKLRTGTLVAATEAAVKAKP